MIEARSCSSLDKETRFWSRIDSCSRERFHFICAILPLSFAWQPFGRVLNPSNRRASIHAHPPLYQYVFMDTTFRECSALVPTIARNNGVNRYAAACLLCLKKASMSALIWSALVVGIPCGKPGYTFKVEFFTIFADIGPAAAIGTI